MGTVFNQEPRFSKENRNYIEFYADELVSIIKKISKENKITFMEALESVKLAYAINNDDIKDEQIQGIAELLRDYINIRSEF